MPTSALAVRTVFTKICGEFVGSLTGRCGHRPLQTWVKNEQGAVHEQDWPSIPEMSRTEIIAVYSQMRVVHLPEPKAIGTVAILRPKRA